MFDQNILDMSKGKPYVKGADTIPLFTSRPHNGHPDGEPSITTAGSKGDTCVSARYKLLEAGPRD